MVKYSGISLNLVFHSHAKEGSLGQRNRPLSESIRPELLNCCRKRNPGPMHREQENGFSKLLYRCNYVLPHISDFQFFNKTAKKFIYADLLLKPNELVLVVTSPKEA